MNLILIEQDELTGGRVVLSDRRAEHILKVLKAIPGQSVRMGILNGALGAGIVQDISTAGVVLTCEFKELPRPERAVSLVLAMPRPKVMKRLWAPLAQMGMRRIFITNAAKVERNYFDTHWLRPAYIHSELIRGLEQAGDTRLPEVRMIRRLKPFIEDELATLYPDSVRILAHPDADASVPAAARDRETVLAVGPEGGWTDFELSLFKQHGFVRMSLGSRRLASDVACIALLATIRGRP